MHAIHLPFLSTSPKEGSVFFVGDIHGCFKPLKSLLAQAKFQPDCHRLICVGDTLNKGPHSLKVLEYLYQIKAEVIRGNHEEGLLFALQQSTYPSWFDPTTYCPDLLNSQKRDFWLDWIRSWPLWIEEEDWIAVHAGLHPQKTLSQTSAEFMTRVRLCNHLGKLTQEKATAGFSPWHHFYHGKKHVFYGHWAKQGVHQTSNTTCLDGGCVYGGELVGYWYPQHIMVDVPGISLPTT